MLKWCFYVNVALLLINQTVAATYIQIVCLRNWFSLSLQRKICHFKKFKYSMAIFFTISQHDSTAQPAYSISKSPFKVPTFIFLKECCLKPCTYIYIRLIEMINIPLFHDLSIMKTQNLKFLSSSQSLCVYILRFLAIRWFHVNQRKCWLNISDRTTIG